MRLENRISPAVVFVSLGATLLLVIGVRGGEREGWRERESETERERENERERERMLKL